MALAECLTCLDNLSLEDIAKLVVVCDESGAVAWRTITVEYSGDCPTCGTYDSFEDYVRKSLYCDENGIYYIRIVSSV